MKKILSILLALTMVFAMSVTAFAAPVDEAVIDMSRACSVNIYKYDLTNAEKDGVWDSSYVSTGVRDVNGVEKVLGEAIRHGDTDKDSDLGNGEKSHGYAIKGVEFSYFKVADIQTYSMPETGANGQTVSDSAEHVEVLYGIEQNDLNRNLLAALLYEVKDQQGNVTSTRPMTFNDSYMPAMQTSNAGGVNKVTYYFQSDVLINGLRAAMEAQPILTKNALESYMAAVGGNKMPLTDADGHTSASNLGIGLYLFVETKVPEMVTDTTAPFFVSLPMTAIDGGAQGSNPGIHATDGGTRWIYDPYLYPKNLTGIPTLEKTLRETKNDTGKNNGSATDITDGYAHTGTASDGDVIDYQIISTLPVITSSTTYLAEYSFVDTLSKGLSYNKNDIVLEFFKDAACTPAQKVATWNQASNKFTVSYSDLGANGESMTIRMTEAGLNEINTSDAVYSGAAMVNSGYSDCTVRITYKATMKSSSDVVYGDAGNPNNVVMTWRRTSNNYYDTLVDDAHVYTYGLDLTKKFSDNQGDFSKVEFIVHNDTDNYFVVGQYNATDKFWYVTGHDAAEANATHFIPTSDGDLMIKGLEDDEYTITEVRTDNKYSLLKDHIKVKISVEETVDLCDIYSKDVLGLLQNDPRYAEIINQANPNHIPFNNMPQKHLEHHLLTASSKIDNNDVTMLADRGSDHAEAPLTVVNTRTFILPQTGGFGNWFFPVIGLSAFTLCMFGIVLLMKKRKTEEGEA